MRIEIECCQSGVYFLLDGNELVYIGSTTDFPRRIIAHNDKRFDRIRFIKCSNFKIYEKRLMRYFKPKYNTQTFTKKQRNELISEGYYQPFNSRFSNGLLK